MEEIRAFIALELPPEAKNAISAVLDEFAPTHQKAVKWVNPESIHLTLKFLGNIPLSRVGAISGVLAKSAEGFPPLKLDLKGLGAFPDLSAPRVVWLGVDGDVPLIRRLQKRVDEGLVELGFIPDKRPFSPHFTLGRVREGVDSQDRRNLAEVVSAFRIPRGASFTIDRMSLIKSTLTRAGAIYEPLAGISLDRIQAE